MRTIAIYDTEIATTNIGDKIIQDSIFAEMEDILDAGFYLKLATHVRNFDPFQMAVMSRGRKLGFFRDADWKFICGTNLITQKRVRFDPRPPQWQLYPSNLSLYEGSVLVGVGTTGDSDQPDFYARWLYRKALDHDFTHSVRDDLTKRYIENLGLKAINTGCPTLWKLTPEFCREIPTKKAPACIFSVSGYKTQRDFEQDEKMIEILERNYEKLYVWIQTPIDESYINQLVGKDRFERIVSLSAYRKKLLEGNVDYVGTRLHGGVYALQHKVRSIIISIDHRAEGFHETNNLPIVRRSEIEAELEKRIQSEFATEIVIDQEAIDEFLNQFRDGKIERKKRIRFRTRIKNAIMSVCNRFKGQNGGGNTNAYN